MRRVRRPDRRDANQRMAVFFIVLVLSFFTTVADAVYECVSIPPAEYTNQGVFLPNATDGEPCAPSPRRPPWLRSTTTTSSSSSSSAAPVPNASAVVVTCGFILGGSTKRRHALAFPHPRVPSNASRSVWILAHVYSGPTKTYLRAVEVAAEVVPGATPPPQGCAVGPDDDPRRPSNVGVARLAFRVVSAWQLERSNVTDTANLTSAVIEEVLADTVPRVPVPVAVSANDVGYGVEWLVWKYKDDDDDKHDASQSQPKANNKKNPFLVSPPSDASHTVADLEKFVSLARRRFADFFGNTNDTSSAGGVDADMKFESDKMHARLAAKVDGYKNTLAKASNRVTVMFDLQDSSADADEVKNLLRNNLRPLAEAASSFHSRGETTAAADASDAVNAALIGLAKRGINATGFDPKFVDEWDVRGQFEFRSSSEHKGRTMFNREDAGLAAAVLHMRTHFFNASSSSSSSPLNDSLGALRTFTSHWGAERRYHNETYHGTTSGLNSDLARILLTSRLWYCLALETKGDGYATRAEHLDAWKAHAERALGINGGIMGTFKPDGTLNHHMMHYGTDYPYKIPFLAAAAAVVTQGTPWQLSDTAALNVAKSLVVAFSFTAAGDAPRSVGGRLMGADVRALRAEHVCAAAVLAEMYPAVNARYGVSLRAAMASLIAGRHGASTSIAPRMAPGPGCIAPWLREARKGKAEEEEREKKETTTTSSSSSVASVTSAFVGRGVTVLPFAGLATFSDARWSGNVSCGGGGGVAVAKGYGPTVKDGFEWQNPKTNMLGAYQSAGNLALLSRRHGASAFREYEDGYDWYRVPGVTAPHRDPRLCPTKSDLSPRGYWPDHPRAFVGGAAERDGRGVGAWGFRFEDMFAPALENATSAYKSYFFIPAASSQRRGGCGGAGAAEGASGAMVVALGSGVRTPDAAAAAAGGVGGWDEVATTLFQSRVAGEGATANTTVDGAVWNATKHASISLAPSSSSSSSSSTTPTRWIRLSDSQGFGYVVAARGGTLRTSVGTQTSLKHSCAGGSTSGEWSAAWIDHGASPDGSDGYEYAVLLDAAADAAGEERERRLAGFKPESSYAVLRRTQRMHAMEVNVSGTERVVAIVVFDESETFPSRAAPMLRVDRPVTALLRRPLMDDDAIDGDRGGGGAASVKVVMTIANPNLGLYRPGEDIDSAFSTERMRLYVRRTRPITTAVTLSGNWTVTLAREATSGAAGPASAGPGDAALVFTAASTFDPRKNQTTVRVKTSAGGGTEVTMTTTKATSHSKPSPTNDPSRSTSPPPPSLSPPSSLMSESSSRASTPRVVLFFFAVVIVLLTTTGQQQQQRGW